MASQWPEEAINSKKFKLPTKVVAIVKNISPDLTSFRKQLNHKGLKAKKDLSKLQCLGDVRGCGVATSEREMRNWVNPKPKALPQGLASPNNWVPGLWH